MRSEAEIAALTIIYYDNLYHAALLCHLSIFRVGEFLWLNFFLYRLNISTLNSDVSFTNNTMILYNFLDLWKNNFKKM